MCSSAVWSVRLLRGAGFFFFSAGLGAGRCPGWGWVLLRFAVFACPARPGVSGSGALAAGGGCLRPGLAWPCLGAVLCRGLGALLAGCLCLLPPWCRSSLCRRWQFCGYPACGLLAAVGGVLRSAVATDLPAWVVGAGGGGVWLCWCWLRLRGGVAPAPCLLSLGKIKRGSGLAAFASVVLSMGGAIRSMPRPLR